MSSQGKVSKPGKRTITRSIRAGLVFPVGRVHRLLKRGRYVKRIGNSAPVFLAAVMEYIIAEVLELAGNVTKDTKKKRILPRHINLAIQHDPELYELFGEITIAKGGVIPHIHEKLLPKKNIAKAVTDEWLIVFLTLIISIGVLINPLSFRRRFDSDCITKHVCRHCFSSLSLNLILNFWKRNKVHEIDLDCLLVTKTVKHSHKKRFLSCARSYLPTDSDWMFLVSICESPMPLGLQRMNRFGNNRTRRCFPSQPKSSDRQTSQRKTSTEPQTNSCLEKIYAFISFVFLSTLDSIRMQWFVCWNVVLLWLEHKSQVMVRFVSFSSTWTRTTSRTEPSQSRRQIGREREFDSFCTFILKLFWNVCQSNKTWHIVSFLVFFTFIFIAVIMCVNDCVISNIFGTKHTHL